MSPVSFFQSGYFWGLAALAVPVVIHLLRPRRSRRFDFSTLRFFKAAAVRAHRARRLKRLLLLLSRLLLLATVVLVFSQPFKKNDPFALLVNPNAAVYCWVDPTKSMDYVEKGAPLWRKAMALVDSLDTRAPFSLRRYWYDDRRQKFVLKNTFHDDHAVFTRHGQSFVRTMAAVFNEETLHSSRPSVLLLFSDFQENISRALDSFFCADTTTSAVICVSCAPDKPWNVGIRNIAASQESPSITVNAIMAGGNERKNTGVSVFLGDLRVGHEVVDLQHDRQTTVSMEVTGRGRSGGYVRLEADDPLPLDNIKYFVRGEGGRRRVIVIGDSIRSFPVVAALRSIGESQWSPVIQRLPKDLSISDIDSADMIVLNEIPFVPRPIHLLRTTKLFGPKAIFLSPAIDSPSFIATVSLLGNPALGTKPRPIQLEKPCGLVFYDTIAMLGKGFHKLVDRDVAVYRYIEPLPGSVLCALDNRKPFATHMLDSLGHSWALFASPLGRTPSNNLCETGLYVPLLDRIARYSLESIHKESDEWIAGRPRRNPFLGSRHPAIVYNVRNERSTQWSNQLQVKFDEPGIYRVQPHDGPSFWIAVNADSEETAMTYRSPKALQRVKGIGAGEFLAHLKAGKGFVFSYGLWIALAALFFVEMLFWERDNGMRNEQIERKV